MSRASCPRSLRHGASFTAPLLRHCCATVAPLLRHCIPNPVTISFSHFRLQRMIPCSVYIPPVSNIHIAPRHVKQPKVGVVMDYHDARDAPSQITFDAAQ